MKKHLFNLLIVGFMLMLAAACSKSDNPAAPSIVGSWKYTSGAGTNCTDPADNYSETCTLSAAECGILVLTTTTYTFTQTPSGGSPTVDSGTYTVSGSTLTTSGGSGPGTLTYTVTATTLTFTQTNSSNGCTETTVFTRQ